jgi:hypothetical protein
MVSILTDFERFLKQRGEHQVDDAHRVRSVAAPVAGN